MIPLGWQVSDYLEEKLRNKTDSKNLKKSKTIIHLGLNEIRDKMRVFETQST